MLKRIIIVVGIILFLLLSIMIAIPFVFKDEIKLAAQEALEESVEADISFDGIGLSLFRSFPNASIGIRQLGIINKAPFQGDTLLYCKRLELEVDFMSLFDENFQVISAGVIDPVVNVLVNKQGEANYDIYKAAPTEVAEEDTAAGQGFNTNIQRYIIENGRVRYEDKTMPVTVTLEGLNHEGSGDLLADNFSFDTKTNIGALSVVFDGVTYLNQTKTKLDAKVQVETEPDGYFITLKENLLTLNELGIAADGTIDMQGEAFMLDLNWNSTDADFRKLISMVPAVYASDIKGIDLRGEADLSGSVQGRYDATHLPGFGVKALVKDGYLKYPDLPNPVSNIQIDFNLKEPDGTFNATKLDIPSFHAELGDAPIDGALSTRGTGPIDIKGRLKTKLDLAQLSQTFPIEKTELKGLLAIDATSDGTYNETKGTFPSTEANIDFSNGYVHYTDYPTELKDIQVHGRINGDENLKQALMEIDKFHFLLDEEAIDGRLRVQDFENPRYELAANGTLDLDKLVEVFPLEDMELGGKIVIEDFLTKGTYSDIEAERYTALPTSGKGRIENLSFNSPDMAEPFLLKQAAFSFDPNKLNISSANGTLGSSDFSASGSINNYLKYALLEGENLTGSFNVQSNTFDVNPWLEEDESASTSGSEEVAYESYPIPPGVDITFNAKVGELLYQNLKIKDANGIMLVQDEAVKLRNTTFNLLGGRAALSGSYATPKGAVEPIFTFMADMSGLAPEKMYEAFGTVQAFAPITKLIQGIADIKFAINGKLGRDLYPILESITSEGFFEVTEGQANSPKFIEKAAQLTGISALDKLDLSGAKGWFTIENGKVQVEPMNIKAGPVLLTLGGAQSITGALDMDLEMDIPAGSVGNAITGKLSSLTGGSITQSDRVKLLFDVGGTITNPALTLKKNTIGNTVKDAVADVVQDKVNQTLKDKTGLDVSGESLKETAAEVEQKVRDSIAAVTAAAKQRAKDSLDAALAREKVKAEEELKKKIEKELGDGAIDKLEDLKNKLPFGKKKKKN